MPLTFGDFQNLTFGDLRDLDLSLGDLASMNTEDLIREVYAKVKRFSLTHSHDLEARFRDLEAKYEQLNQTRPTKEKLSLSDKINIGIALLTMVITLLTQSSTEQHTNIYNQLQTEYDIMQTQVIILDENSDADQLQAIEQKLEKLLTQTSGLMDRQEELNNQYENIKNSIEANHNHQAPQTNQDAYTITGDTTPDNTKP